MSSQIGVRRAEASRARPSTTGDEMADGRERSTTDDQPNRDSVSFEVGGTRVSEARR
jgi:hypothetical protein